MPTPEPRASHGGSEELFEQDLKLPDAQLTKLPARLIGFEERYRRIERDLRLLIDRDGLRAWSRKQYGRELPLLAAIEDRYPLVAFHGDVGTGKTATAEATANRLTSELKREIRPLTYS